MQSLANYGSWAKSQLLATFFFVYKVLLEYNYAFFFLHIVYGCFHVKTAVDE